MGASYGSDRAVQCYGMAVLWYALLEKKEELESLTDYILNNLLPQLDLKNVHNTFMLLFPVLCTMKRRGMFQEARRIFTANITEKFQEHFGEGKTTFFRSMYKPTEILYTLGGGSWLDANIKPWEEMVDWALQSETGKFSPHMESATRGVGRDGTGTVAEICYLLAKSDIVHNYGNLAKRLHLIEKGIILVEESLEKTKDSKVNLYAHNQSLEVHEALLNLATLNTMS